MELVRWLIPRPNQIMNNIQEIQEWLAKSRNRKFFDISCAEVNQTLSSKITYSDCVSLGSNLRELNVWWMNQFLADVYSKAHPQNLWVD
jgi:hypothetical protein